jgi:hypothetical protein
VADLKLPFNYRIDRERQCTWHLAEGTEAGGGLDCLAFLFSTYTCRRLLHMTSYHLALQNFRIGIYQKEIKQKK